LARAVASITGNKDEEKRRQGQECGAYKKISSFYKKNKNQNLKNLFFINNQKNDFFS